MAGAARTTRATWRRRWRAAGWIGGGVVALLCAVNPPWSWTYPARTAAATGPAAVPTIPDPVHRPPVGPAPDPAPLTRHDFREVHFGNIPVELTLYARDAAQAQAAARRAFARVAALGAMMNDYALDPPSPLNRIAAEAPRPVVVPAELLAALRRAVDHHRFTGGAFDVTAKPLTQLWRVSRQVGRLPPAERLRRARRMVDIGALELGGDQSTARLTRQGMWLDLGGLAKGLIGDEVVGLLREQGLPRCRYHAGGDMVFGDAPPGQPGWEVRVVDFPVAGEPEGVLTFRASNSAVSVSGDVYRFVEIDGVRYAHVIDPRTGLGVTERRITCVRGPRGVDTDPLATAGLILDAASWQAALARVPGCRGQVARIGSKR